MSLSIIKSSPRRRKTVERSINRTFRIDAAIASQLYELAMEKQVSANSLANKALRKMIQDAPLEMFDLVPTPSALLVKMIGYLSEEETAELGHWSATTFARDLVWSASKDITPQALIQTCERLTALHHRHFQFEHTSHSDEHTITLKHVLSSKWTTLFAEAIRYSLRDLFGMEANVTNLGNHVVVKFTLGRYGGAPPEMTRLFY